MSRNLRFTLPDPVKGLKWARVVRRSQVQEKPGPHKLHFFALGRESSGDHFGWLQADAQDL
jgi:hypothetical protein